MVSDNNGVSFNKTVNASSCMVYIHGLKPAHLYFFRVAAFTKEGVGPYSTPLALQIASPREPSQYNLPVVPSPIMKEVWFIGITGCLGFLVMFILVFLLYMKRMRSNKLVEDPQVVTFKIADQFHHTLLTDPRGSLMRPRKFPPLPLTTNNNQSDHQILTVSLTYYVHSFNKIFFLYHKNRNINMKNIKQRMY